MGVSQEQPPIPQPYNAMVELYHADRFCGYVELRDLGMQEGGDELGKRQQEALTGLRSEYLQSTEKEINGASNRERRVFENPSIIPLQNKSDNGNPTEVTFGNKNHQAIFSWERFEDVLDGIYGGKVTDPKLSKGIEKAKLIVEALRDGQKVVLIFPTFQKSEQIMET